MTLVFVALAAVASQAHAAEDWFLGADEVFLGTHEDVLAAPRIIVAERQAMFDLTILDTKNPAFPAGTYYAYTVWVHLLR